MSSEQWHLAYVLADIVTEMPRYAYHRMTEWCTANVREEHIAWKCTFDMQVSEYWVFGFKNKEDAVHFTMCFA